MRLLVAFIALLGMAVPVHAEWRKSETRHFTIYSAGKEQALRVFAVKVERFDTMLRARFKISDADMPQKLTIFMLPSGPAVEKAYGAGVKNIAGFYIPNAEGSIAVVNRENASDKFSLDADTVLFHEYMHHFMTHYFPAAYPAWFSEGFAEFFASSDFTPAGNAKVGMPAYYRGYGMLTQAVIPVEQILSANVSDFSKEQVDVFYGRAWLLVHYLTLSGSRSGQIDRYLNAVNAGTPNLEAARQAFGDLKQLDRDLKAYFEKSKISYIQELRPTPPPDRIDISIVSPAVGATMMQRLLLRRGPRDDELPQLVADLKAAAAKYPQEADPQLLLAESEFLSGNDSAALQAADAALAITPNLGRAMLAKGKAMMRQNIKDNVAQAERWKVARGWIVKANRADTNDPMPLYAYFESFGQQGIPPAESALAGLRRAYEMVPEARGVRMTYAYSLANRRDYAAAIRLVETVAFDPHNGPGAAEARSILKRLHAAQDGKVADEQDLFGDAMENKEGK